MPPKSTRTRVSGMTTRQKIIAGALVIVLLFILWQIVGLFGGGGGGTPPPITPIKPNQMTATSPTTGSPTGTQPITTPGAPTPTTPTPMPTPTANTPAPEVVEQPQPTQLSTGTVSLDNQIIKLQKESEQKFIDQLNQLQMLRVQRDIAETNQAIAAARLATVTAEKNVSDLLTKPSQPTTPISALQQPPPPLPPVPEGAYAKALGGATTQGIPGAPTVTAPPTPPPPPAPVPNTVVVIPEVKYVVISVSMQLGKWSAILGYEGKLFSVSVGDVLPPDNSVVASINKNGVVLVNKGKRRKLSMVTSV